MKIDSTLSFTIFNPNATPPFVVNISQIKHTWFSFVFLFVTDLSNYNAVIFTGKKSARMEGVHAFILSMKGNHRTNHIRKDPYRLYKTYLVLIKRFTLVKLFACHIVLTDSCLQAFCP